MKQKKLNKQNKFNQGFSLIEILVALVLVSTIMALSISNPFSSRDNLETEVNNIKRAINFTSDESALRNSVTRVHFYLNKDPQEYSVEYGPSSQFVLPPVNEDSIQIKTKDEEEEDKKKEKELNQKFARIIDFNDKNAELADDVKIIAFGNSNSKILQTTGEVSFYSFPSGEKDEIFLALALDDNMATITTKAFQSKVSHNYYQFDKIDEDTKNDIYMKKAKELFEVWSREKR